MRSPLFLQHDAKLDLDPQGPRLYRLQADRPKHELTIGEAVALNLLAAYGELANAKSHCATIFGEILGTALVDQVVDRFWTYLGDGPRRSLDVAWLAEMKVDRLRLPPRRRAAPLAVTWLVTLGCNRKCPYCFHDITRHAVGRMDSPRDATFPLDNALRFVAEMAYVGASDLYLTGGEPLLRRDIVEIIAAASRKRVRVRVVTKYPVSQEFACKLAEAGLHDATVSLDDARSYVASSLAGAPGYLKEAEEAIRAFLDAGIRLRVNAVVSRVNQGSLCELAERLIDWGVPELVISPYVTPRSARTNVQQLAPPIGSFYGDVQKLKDRCGERLRIQTGGSMIPDGLTERACGRHVDCNVGIDTLDVLPDGRVTRCRYLPNEDALIVGDLRTQTLMDIWDSTAMERLGKPARSEYGTSLCADCDGFEACNSRGRCYFTALGPEKQ